MLTAELDQSMRSRLTGALFGYSLTALLLPVLAAVGDPPAGLAWAIPVALLSGAAGAALGMTRPARPVYAWLGATAVFVAAWLIPQTGQPWVICVLGLIIGMGFGLAAPPPSALREGWAVAFGALGVLQLGVLALVAGDDAATIAGVLYAIAIAVRGTTASPRDATARGAPLAIAVGTVLLMLLTASWIGANERTITWFGKLVNHGPRGQPQVAITFDDGPNEHATLPVAHILDRNHTKGTFFTVGKALVRRPDISRALMADGQLLGNHSYLHDAIRWLDPRYPELERTQRAFKRELGVCPTFFRPPHGQHTPFMADVVSDHGMTMVGWDDAGGDWATRDAALVARRILDKVRNGSIILLHDGSDGDVTSDRTVVVKALPLILAGLRARHLTPVRLDRLLGRPGYGAHC